MKNVLGIGNALVDMLISLESDDLLSEFGLAKGSMTLIDREKMLAILEQTTACRLVTRKSSGGSTANSIHGLAKLGAPAGYIGKIGQDDFGQFFNSYMTQDNICTKVFTGIQDTGKSMVMISPDSERTFGTYLGAAIELNPGDLSVELFQGYDYFLLEGYLVQNHPLVETAVKLARQAGSTTAIDLASYNVVSANLDFLRDIIGSYIDIVFANEEESRAFTGKQKATDALADIAKLCDIAVVKTGKKGSLIREGSHSFAVDAILASAVDTTGAGDLYASGFFYGLASGQPLDICGKIGSITSGKIVEVIGAKMDEQKWQEARRMIEAVLR